MRTTLSFISQIIHGLARPATVFYVLAWLMVLLVLGTLAQRYVGLYAAQQTFFYSVLWWAGPVPLPGGVPALTVLTLALAAKLLVATRCSGAQAGIIITHAGALLLMVGALLTFVTSRDGQITLFESEKTGYYTAYHDRALVIEDGGSSTVLTQIPWSRLKPGARIDLSAGMGSVEIIKICRNCHFIDRVQNPGADGPEELRGRAQNFDIAPALLELDDEANRAAILFRLSGTTTEKDGIHLSADFIDQSPWFRHGEKTINIALRKIRTPLPFTVELVKFSKDLHPGTDMARSYQSDVMIHENGTSWPATIRMNAPLYYRGYTLYQSSFVSDGTRQGSVLAVVQNKGRIFPYLAGSVMMVGLLWHVLIRLRAGLSVFFLILALSSVAQAGEVDARRVDLTSFGALPILDQGRIKPMDTFARSWLEIFSGRDHIDDMPATAWMAMLLFTPQETQDIPVFRIQNAMVRDMLALPLRPGNRYAFRDILPKLDSARTTWEPLLTADINKLSLPQKQLLELIQNIDGYIEISRALSCVRRDINLGSMESAKNLGLKTVRASYIDLLRVRKTLEEKVRGLVQKAQEQDPNKKMTDDEIALVDLVRTMQDRDTHKALGLFRVVPTHGVKDWKTPWAALENKESEAHQILILWQDLAEAYTNKDDPKFNKTIARIDMITAPFAKAAPLSTEYFLNRLQPFYFSLWCYALALVFVIVGKTFFVSRRVAHISGLFLTSGILFHLLGLVLRMAITLRPPVTNLYDSIIFVGLVAVCVAWVIEHKRRDGMFLILAAFTGVMLQSIGIKFDSEGDTLRVLMPVLDTNFWLATHVVMVTIGYALAILSGLLAHMALMAPLWPHHAANDNHFPFRRHLMILALAALFCTATGTILGGIWADQSWGRFWGWDPKENGALLIVLWIAWALHGRISGHFTAHLFTSALAALLVVVAMAWFGVNLLGVGLHSYGFTQSAMLGFSVFCILDLALIAALYIMNRVRGTHGE